MIENLQKTGKMMFDSVKPDFCWYICPDSINSENEENYRKLLRKIYRHNSAMHEYDKDRFSIFDK